jgi:hypothetical protein
MCFRDEHEVISAGTTIPAAPAAAAVPRKLLLVIDDFFITVLMNGLKLILMLSVFVYQFYLSVGHIVSLPY